MQEQDEASIGQGEGAREGVAADAPLGIDAPPPASALPPPEPASADEAPRWSRRRLLFEIAAVLCIGVVMDLFSAVWALAWSEWHGDDRADTDAYTMTWLMVRAISVVVPVVYIMWASGEPLARFGFRRLRPMRDMLWGLLLTGGSWFAWYATIMLWYAGVAIGWVDYPDLQIGTDYAGAPHPYIPSAPIAWLLFSLGIFANSVGEEVVVRGYLVTRLRDLTGSTGCAVVLSSIVFGAYHLYYGWFEAFTIAVGGLVFAAFFAWRGRLWPLVIAHTAWNLMSYALAGS